MSIQLFQLFQLFQPFQLFQLLVTQVDRESNGGRGSVVGLLKMGKKNLFLLDRQGDQVT
jgi:hypothetical protein